MKTDNTNRRNKKATDHKGNVYESIAAMCRVTDKTRKKCLMTLYDIMESENIKHIF